MNALEWSRLQFGFTITYHYLFSQLTMGLALIILAFKLLAIRTEAPEYEELAGFWGRIFGLNFAMGVVTGIPMEFQFGTNWARFSDFSGGVIGVTLALEGMVAFFAESAFLGLFLAGPTKVGPRVHLLAAVMLYLGSWLSGYFIVATNAFMQHPTGYALGDSGKLIVVDGARYLFNAWALWEYAHTMTAAVVTAAFVVSAVTAYWMLMGRYASHSTKALGVGVVAGVVACALLAFPTGDHQGQLVAQHQRPTLAAMEGKFESGAHSDLAIFGQPNVRERRLENPVVVPWALSLLAYGSFGATVYGLNDIPEDQWPESIELLYFSYHIMAGLGTLLMGVMGVAAFLLWRRRLHRTRPMLWVLMLAFPFPYIATTAGWMTAELGRQPWSIYGLLRTKQGGSPNLGGGDVVFTTLGYAGLYLVLGLLFVFLVGREVVRGPVSAPVAGRS